MQEISLYAAACSCELCLQILDKWIPCEGDFRPNGHLWLCFQRPSCLMRERGRVVPRGLRGLAPEPRLVRARAAGPHQVPRSRLAAGSESGHEKPRAFLSTPRCSHPLVSDCYLRLHLNSLLITVFIINSTPGIQLWSVMNIQSSKYVIWMLCYSMMGSISFWFFFFCP